MRIITLDNLKKFLEKLPQPKQDALLVQIIEQQSQRFETFLRRKLKAEERTEFFDGGEKSYWLPAFPIDEGQTLTVTRTTDNFVFVKDTDYFVRADEGLIEFANKIPRGLPKLLSITWTGGYTENANTNVIEVPDDLQHACILQCIFVYRRRKDIGLSSVSNPDGNISVMTPVQLLPEVRAILDNYKAFSI